MPQKEIPMFDGLVSWEDKHSLYHKRTNATKKHQYKRDLIQLSFLVQKLRNGY